MNLRPNNTGLSINHDLKGCAAGQVVLMYKGRFCPPNLSHVEIECEVYEADGIFSVHAVCPKCRHALWIDGRNKKVEYDKRDGKLFVEPFMCPWEMTTERQSFGIGLCQLRLAFDGKVVKEA